MSLPQSSLEAHALVFSDMTTITSVYPLQIMKHITNLKRYSVIKI